MRRHDIRMDNKALQDEFAPYMRIRKKSMTGSCDAKSTFGQNAHRSAATLKVGCFCAVGKEHENG